MSHLFNRLCTSLGGGGCNIEISVVTTELRFITFGFEPAHKWTGKLLGILGMKSVFTLDCIPSLSFIDS